MKRFLTTTVAIALCASMMAACSNGAAETTATSASESETQTEATTTTTTAATSASTSMPEGIGGPGEDMPSDTQQDEPEDDDPMGKTGQHNLPLKDRLDDAKYAVEVAMQTYLQETYGDKVFDARIYVKKILNYNEEQDAGLTDLGIDKLAFEVEYELKPASSATEDDINSMLAGNGEYDKETGWINGKYGCGILEPNKSGDPEYVIKRLSTAF